MLKASMKYLMNHKGRVIEIGTGLYFGKDAYDMARAEGYGKGVSLARGASEFMLPIMMSLKGFVGMQALTSAPSLVKEGLTLYDAHARTLGRERVARAFSDMTYQDTESAHTMRQAGMAQMKRARYHMEHAMLGREASYLRK